MSRFIFQVRHISRFRIENKLTAISITAHTAVRRDKQRGWRETHTAAYGLDACTKTHARTTHTHTHKGHALAEHLLTAATAGTTAAAQPGHGLVWFELIGSSRERLSGWPFLVVQ